MVRVKFATSVMLLILWCTSLTSCVSSSNEEKYVSDKNNYISATAVVSEVYYLNDMGEIFLTLTDIKYQEPKAKEFEVEFFKINKKNTDIIKKLGIDKITIGVEISFSALPKVFANGYRLPIARIEVDGETLLDFEIGYNNIINSC